jgi:TonB-dependent receptor
VPPLHLPFKPAANFTIGNLQRIFKDIDEESEQATGNLKLPFKSWTDTDGWLKVGAFHDHVSRKFNQDTFSNFNDNSSFSSPFEDFWSAHFPDQNHPITASDQDVDYHAHQQVGAWYGMLDLPLADGLELVTGARVESTRIDIENLPESGAFWFPPGSLAPTHLNPGDADVDFAQTDVLPSIGLAWRPLDGVTLRAAYSKTVARQTFKELTPIIQQEFLGGPIFIGNPDLQMSALDNYDLRADWAPYDGALASMSWFRKEIKRPIEYVQQVADNFDFTTAVNYPKGTLSGYEFELRQHLGHFVESLDGLSVGANATFINAKVRLPDDEVAAFAQPGIEMTITQRDMTNAPSHLYNAFLTWDLTDAGTQIGAFYTVTGDTLLAGAGQSGGNFVPSVYMTQYDNLNVTLTQAIGKYFRIGLGAKNLTNPELREVYRSPIGGPDVTHREHTEGIEYSLSLAFEARF